MAHIVMVGEGPPLLGRATRPASPESTMRVPERSAPGMMAARAARLRNSVSNGPVRQCYRIVDFDVGTMRVTTILERSRQVGTRGAMSFFQ